MKKVILLAALCMMNVVLNAQDYELRTLTFEDVDAKFAPYTLTYANKTISKWSDLVDDAQYNGTLTYNMNGGTYHWCDENNTLLQHSFTTPYWGGGHAISNYTSNGYSNDDLPAGTYGWYEVQFATLTGGNDSSVNFCVHMGYVDFYNSGMNPDAILQTIRFADGVARIIDHMYVTNICYTLNSLVYGDGFCPPAGENSKLEIVAIGQDANGNEISRTTFALCNTKNDIVTTWKKWDLSVLGKVASVAFNFEASEDLIGAYGLNCPAYFAYDDVAVRFDKGETTSIPNVQHGANSAAKVILQGTQILILRDGKTYNVTGQEIKH